MPVDNNAAKSKAQNKGTTNLVETIGEVDLILEEIHDDTRFTPEERQGLLDQIRDFAKSVRQESRTSEGHDKVVKRQELTVYSSNRNAVTTRTNDDPVRDRVISWLDARVAEGKLRWDSLEEINMKWIATISRLSPDEQRRFFEYIEDMLNGRGHFVMVTHGTGDSATTRFKFLDDLDDLRLEIEDLKRITDKFPGITVGNFDGKVTAMQLIDDGTVRVNADGDLVLTNSQGTWTMPLDRLVVSIQNAALNAEEDSHNDDLVIIGGTRQREIKHLFQVR
jgi:hypothetical protein